LLPLLLHKRSLWEWAKYMPESRWNRRDVAPGEDKIGFQGNMRLHRIPRVGIPEKATKFTFIVKGMTKISELKVPKMVVFRNKKFLFSDSLILSI
jgi:hypothetical protein